MCGLGLLLADDDRLGPGWDAWDAWDAWDGWDGWDGWDEWFLWNDGLWLCYGLFGVGYCLNDCFFGVFERLGWVWGGGGCWCILVLTVIIIFIYVNSK